MHTETLFLGEPDYHRSPSTRIDELPSNLVHKTHLKTNASSRTPWSRSNRAEHRHKLNDMSSFATDILVCGQNPDRFQKKNNFLTGAINDVETPKRGLADQFSVFLLAESHLDLMQR
jgi:hypothetical protein